MKYTAALPHERTLLSGLPYGLPSTALIWTGRDGRVGSVPESTNDRYMKASLMNITEIRTDHLAPQDRFPCWLELATRMYVPSRISCDDTADFRALARVVDMGAVQISELTVSTVDVERTAKMVRQFDPEVYQLHLISSGDGHLAQVGRDASFHARQFVLIDSSQPYQGRRSSPTG